MSQQAFCACKPGAHADGWQERRSEACIEREREAWRQMLTRYSDSASRVQAIEAAEDHADQVVFDAWRERGL